MQIPDIVFQQDERNRPGRLSLVQVSETPFDSGTLALSGTSITLDLPRPPIGFARRWEHLHATASAFASPDDMFFSRISPDQTTGTVVAYFQTNANWTKPIPIIGNVSFFTGFSSGMFGAPPFFAGQEILRIFFQFGAAAGQTANVRGWYKDIPI